MKSIDTIYENSLNNKTDSGTRLVTNKDAQAYKYIFRKIEHRKCISLSMPNSLNITLKNNNVEYTTNCDKSSKINRENLPSPSQQWWFKTWPERYDKLKNNVGMDNAVVISNNYTNTQITSRMCDKTNDIKNLNSRVTLNEALQNISLAYSPVTKQLHLLSNDKNLDKQNRNLSEQICDKKVEDSVEEPIIKKFGHKRNDPGSFSSTISSLSDPSPSGSLLDAEERCSIGSEDTDYKLHKKSFGFLNTSNIFSWKSHSASNLIGWKVFNKLPHESNSSPRQVVASSSALIQNIRPPNLPAKTFEEEQRHREEYKAIIAAAKKKEVQNTAAKQKQQKILLRQEEQFAASTKHFTQLVLPNWNSMYKSRKTKDLWWQGLPSSVRGKVWQLAIGNDLNLTQQLYEICLQRAQNRLNTTDSSYFESDVDQESSMNAIQLDISRTFPNLCIFQEGGPYFDILHSLLAAYVCYRPDVGYVQGMSFIAAILILNMDEVDAFMCFANLLNRPLHLAAFTLNQSQMQAYYNAYNETFSYNLPKLHSHFEKSGLTPDLYLLDWIYTIFAKAMPLDIVCRVWDVFFRDGEEFIFKAAIGVLRLNQEELMHMDFLQGAQFLIRLPDHLASDMLFKNIQAISMNIGKQTFSHIVERCKKISH